ncbi:hypothetical protein BSK61_24460 [Paenibacillus odorifer]|nr:hypothetical protein BSK55_29130 [Paenibacillus odorifer]OME48736.1 hypothetical protein BSK61_24460 [Paenibacillus odorifer]
MWDREVLIDKMSKVNAAQTIAVSDQEPVIEVMMSVVVSPSNVEDDLYICARCGKPVTHKVKEYCLSNTKRFKGRIYCYDHQRMLVHGEVK